MVGNWMFFLFFGFFVRVSCWVTPLCQDAWANKSMTVTQPLVLSKNHLSIKNWKGPYQRTPKLRSSYSILRFLSGPKWTRGSGSWRYLWIQHVFDSPKWGLIFWKIWLNKRTDALTVYRGPDFLEICCLRYTWLWKIGIFIIAYNNLSKKTGFFIIPHLVGGFNPSETY